MTTVNLLKFVVQNNNSDHGDICTKIFQSLVDAESYQEELAESIIKWFNDEIETAVSITAFFQLENENDYELNEEELDTIIALEKELNSGNPNIRISTGYKNTKPTKILIGHGNYCKNSKANCHGCTWYPVECFLESDFLIGVFKDLNAKYPFYNWKIKNRIQKEKQLKIIELKNKHYDTFVSDAHIAEAEVNILKALLNLAQKTLDDAFQIEIEQRGIMENRIHYINEQYS